MKAVNWLTWAQGGGVALGFLLILLAVTNPSREAYLEYATFKLADDVKEEICGARDLRNLLGEVANLVSGICRTGVDVQRSKIREFISNASRRRNLVVFSLYTTDVLDRRYTTIAILGNFHTSVKKASQN
ncbi:MAG: DUF4359 domain-containing protein [Pseudanabaenaceae cyanobacterium]